MGIQEIGSIKYNIWTLIKNNDSFQKYISEFEHRLSHRIMVLLTKGLLDIFNLDEIFLKRVT
jgi:hypothetical protein